MSRSSDEKQWLARNHRQRARCQDILRSPHCASYFISRIRMVKRRQHLPKRPVGGGCEDCWKMLVMAGKLLEAGALVVEKVKLALGPAKRMRHVSSQRYCPSSIPSCAVPKCCRQLFSPTPGLRDHVSCKRKVLATPDQASCNWKCPVM